MGSGLREGWEVRKLGEVCKIYQPKTISKKQMNPDGKYFVFGANGIIGKYNEYNHENPQLLVTCRGATCGSVNISKPKSWINGNAMVIQSEDNSLNIKFLEYLFRGGIDISSIITGAAQPQITRQNLAPILIPIPPLQEQEKIVAILDEAFLAIEKAKANTQTNLQNAKELFESYLQGVFENRGEGWEEKSLEEISVTFGRGKSKHRPRNDKKLYGGIYPFLQTGDVRHSNHFITNYSQTYNEIGLAQSKLWETGTICITIAANIAETGVLTFDACFPDSIIGITVNKKFADIDFVEYLLQSFKVHIQSLSKGSAQENINLATFQDKQFPFPPLKEQKQIVKKLNTLQKETKKLESIYTQKLLDLEELKKSLLQKAFSGELL